MQKEKFQTLYADQRREHLIRHVSAVECQLSHRTAVDERREGLRLKVDVTEVDAEQLWQAVEMAYSIATERLSEKPLCA